MECYRTLLACGCNMPALELKDTKEEEIEQLQQLETRCGR